MDSALHFLTLGFHVVMALAIVAGIVWWLGQVRRASRTLGLIVACGLLLRLGLGLFFFWVAERHLPVLQSLRRPDGVWIFALDSVAYLRGALLMVTEGFSAMPAAFSPDYAVWLAVWMRLLGPSVITAPFLNLTLFALVCWLIVKTAMPVGRDREDLPQLVAAGSFAFSPALLFHGSQALKDDLCAAIVAVSCVGALHFFSHREAHGGSRRQAIGLLTLVIAGYLLFGIRNYATGLIGCATCVASVLPWAHRSSTWRIPALGAGAVLVVIIGAGAALRMGAAGEIVAARVEAGRQWVVDSSAKALHTPDRLRHNFHRTGGNTNLAPGPVPSGKFKPGSISWTERGRGLLTGLGAIFIPMTLLKATGAVDIGIGPGLRIATDVDTLFLDASIIAALLLLTRRREAARRHLRYVCFVLTLALLTTVFMAYIVTNFGTLFRLRVLLAVPIWMLGVAFSPVGLREALRVRNAQWTNTADRTPS